MRMEKPVEEGNANEILEACYPLIKLVLLRCEAIVGHLIEVRNRWGASRQKLFHKTLVGEET